ncbi:LOW QUALITY PROTEIN: hypothetical protein T552_04073 [Pneumocystis carinii B80]|uniref:Uncharacterized protein n=1 Tax=Pneumocystis carinii (strain B80) TaxID=1408658 RepID=A0A0W4ZP72_PNEC8|nr:LOW QUALITY PROTEIN: hypothetical protein T552_04073 [Pneumocystis carinii B80]KTW30160.1 LOW QUALITY PROTEIN: hypothetical protein T552_04073 [Pneumocystis carinii B80]
MVTIISILSSICWKKYTIVLKNLLYSKGSPLLFKKSIINISNIDNISKIINRMKNSSESYPIEYKKIFRWINIMKTLCTLNSKNCIDGKS